MSVQKISGLTMSWYGVIAMVRGDREGKEEVCTVTDRC